MCKKSRQTGSSASSSTAGTRLLFLLTLHLATALRMSGFGGFGGYGGGSNPSPIPARSRGPSSTTPAPLAPPSQWQEQPQTQQQATVPAVIPARSRGPSGPPPTLSTPQPVPLGALWESEYQPQAPAQTWSDPPIPARSRGPSEPQQVAALMQGDISISARSRGPSEPRQAATSPTAGNHWQMQLQAALGQKGPEQPPPRQQQQEQQQQQQQQQQAQPPLQIPARSRGPSESLMTMNNPPPPSPAPSPSRPFSTTQFDQIGRQGQFGGNGMTPMTSGVQRMGFALGQAPGTGPPGLNVRASSQPPQPQSQPRQATSSSRSRGPETVRSSSASPFPVASPAQQQRLVVHSEEEKNVHNEQCLNFLSQLAIDSQLVVVLVGLPGCGKSTFAAQIKSSCPEGAWCVACQDVLGDRQKVVAQVTRVLEGTADGFIGGRVIVDRCNFDVAQRKHWVDVVNTHRRERPDIATHILCVTLFNADNESFCAGRAEARGNDGVHSGDENWTSIVGRMRGDFKAPSMAEGFDAMFWCHSRDDMDLILTMLASAPNLFTF